MAGDVITDGGTQYANLLATGYDKFLEYQLRSTPIFRQVVDKHPADVTNPGPSVVLTIINEIASLATTPLNELLDVAAVAPPAPSRVTVTLNEYGNADIATLRLKELAFTAPEPAIANVLGKNMVDTIDKLVQTVLDSSARIIGVNGGVVKTDSNSFAEGSVAATDVFSSAVARTAVALLKRRNAVPMDARGQFLAIVHPDVSLDFKNDNGWLNPHNYVDTANVYNGEIGSYMGARFVESPRCTVVADGASSAKVYRTYFVGHQALVEAVASEPHIVVGPQTDRLRRFFPIGWYAHLGWAMFRQEAVQVARTSSSIAAL